eukprot:IDg1271t1
MDRTPRPSVSGNIYNEFNQEEIQQMFAIDQPQMSGIRIPTNLIPNQNFPHSISNSEHQNDLSYYGKPASRNEKILSDSRTSLAVPDNTSTTETPNMPRKSNSRTPCIVKHRRSAQGSLKPMNALPRIPPIRTPKNRNQTHRGLHTQSSHPTFSYELQPYGFHWKHGNRSNCRILCFPKYCYGSIWKHVRYWCSYARRSHIPCTWKHGFCTCITRDSIQKNLIRTRADAISEVDTHTTIPLQPRISEIGVFSQQHADLAVPSSNHTRGGQTMTIRRSQLNGTGSVNTCPVIPSPNSNSRVIGGATASNAVSSRQNPHSSTAAAQLVTIANDILVHLVKAREDDRKRSQDEQIILKQMQDTMSTLSVQMDSLCSAVSSAFNRNSGVSTAPEISQLAILAQNYVKLRTLLGMDPREMTASLYSASADQFCEPIREASEFAMGEVNNDELLSFYTQAVPLKSGKPSGMTVLAFISRGQSRAHDTIQKHLIRAFYDHCPVQCPLRSTAAASEEESKSSAKGTVQDIVEKRPNAKLSKVWVEKEDDLQRNTVEMSICAFAFVITKISFDVRRKMHGGIPRGELNMSQQVPWAIEAMNIDHILGQQESVHGFNGVFQIGRVVFLHRLSPDCKDKLKSLVDRTST